MASWLGKARKLTTNWIIQPHAPAQLNPIPGPSSLPRRALPNMARLLQMLCRLLAVGSCSISFSEGPNNCLGQLTKVVFKEHSKCKNDMNLLLLMASCQTNYCTCFVFIGINLSLHCVFQIMRVMKLEKQKFFWKKVPKTSNVCLIVVSNINLSSNKSFSSLQYKRDLHYWIRCNVFGNLLRQHF